MATTRLMPLHIRKGRSVATALGRSIGYIENPNKTGHGEWVSAYECDPMIADSEFAYSKRMYLEETGRSQGKRDVIAYHLRQSFKPGEIDPETANKIGYDLVMSLTKGKHTFIVCTHTDKHHIHSHIIFNSTSLDCTRKFQNFWNSSFAIRRISDQLCLENGLSVIEDPKPSRGSYGTWLGDDKQPTQRDKLRHLIDTLLEQKPTDIGTLHTLLRDAGCELKQGKTLSIKLPGAARFLRCNSLGEDYTAAAIAERISGKRIVAKASQTAIHTAPAKPNLLIDIQAKIQQAHSPGFERWAKIFNLKEMAKTVLYLQDMGITEYDTLESASKEASAKHREMVAKMRANSARMTEIKELQNHIGNYKKYNEVYGQYVAGGKKERFYESRRTEISLCETAMRHFKSNGYGKGKKKLPKMEMLKREYATLAAENKKLSPQQKQAREKKMELLAAKGNTERILGMSLEQENRILKEREASR